MYSNYSLPVCLGNLRAVQCADRKGVRKFFVLGNRQVHKIDELLYSILLHYVFYVMLQERKKCGMLHLSIFLNIQFNFSYVLKCLSNNVFSIHHANVQWRIIQA